MTNKLSAISRQRPAVLNYIWIARPDHWVKNVFLLPGIALAWMFGGTLSFDLLSRTAIALFSLCLIASANYTINEYLDAAFDQFHPTKRNRPGARGVLKWQLVSFQYVLLACIGLTLAYMIGRMFFYTSALLLLMGVLYNIEPIRTKDRPYLDVLSESINNPIRLLLGWFVVIGNALPPSSTILAYWMGGAFLMAMKRYSEYRQIGNPAIAGSYRKSFRHYTENTLLLSSFFYALNAAFFIGVFLIKYRIEYVVVLPAITFAFVWYMAIALKHDSAAAAPEKLYREPRFLAYVSCVWLLLIGATFVNVPLLQTLIVPVLYETDGPCQGAFCMPLKSITSNNLFGRP